MEQSPETEEGWKSTKRIQTHIHSYINVINIEMSVQDRKAMGNRKFIYIVSYVSIEDKYTSTNVTKVD